MGTLVLAAPAFFVAILVAISLFGACLHLLITRLSVSASGLNRLAQRYTVAMAPAGQPMRRRTLMIGAVRWRHCVDVALYPDGLYIHVRQFMARFPPLLIPWSDLRLQGETLLYWDRAMRFEVGSPAVTTLVVRMPLYNAMKPYL